MKKISSQIPVFLILCSVITAFSAFRVEPKKYKIHITPVNKYFDVAVGHRTTDSTGQLNISNSTIQQSIIPGISMIYNATITSENASLMVGRKTAFLLFNVTDSSGIKSAVAVQLYESGFGDFTFHSGTGKALHIATGINGCNNCFFKMEFGIIRSATCDSNTLCKHQIHYSM